MISSCDSTSRLKAAQPLILDHSYSPSKQSTNFQMAPSHTVLLHFADEATADRAMVGNDVTRDIYLKYANGTTIPVNFEQRRPGQGVWRH